MCEGNLNVVKVFSYFFVIISRNIIVLLILSDLRQTYENPANG